MDQQYGLVWNFPKKSAAKSNAERAWQTTVNKDSTVYETRDLAPMIVIRMFISCFANAVDAKDYNFRVS